MTDALTHLTHISSTGVNLAVSLRHKDENPFSAAHRKSASGASVRQESWAASRDLFHAGTNQVLKSRAAGFGSIQLAILQVIEGVGDEREVLWADRHSRLAEVHSRRANTKQQHYPIELLLVAVVFPTVHSIRGFNARSLNIFGEEGCRGHVQNSRRFNFVRTILPEPTSDATVTIPSAKIHPGMSRSDACYRTASGEWSPAMTLPQELERAIGIEVMKSAGFTPDE